MIKKEKDLEFMPNQKLHRNISFTKSVVRIIGYFALPFNLMLAMSILLFSELLGVLEELV